MPFDPTKFVSAVTKIKGLTPKDLLDKKNKVLEAEKNAIEAESKEIKALFEDAGLTNDELTALQIDINKLPKTWKAFHVMLDQKIAAFTQTQKELQKQLDELDLEIARREKEELEQKDSLAVRQAIFTQIQAGSFSTLDKEKAEEILLYPELKGEYEIKPMTPGVGGLPTEYFFVKKGTVDAGIIHIDEIEMPTELGKKEITLDKQIAFIESQRKNELEEVDKDVNERGISLSVTAYNKRKAEINEKYDAKLKALGATIESKKETHTVEQKEVVKHVFAKFPDRSTGFTEKSFKDSQNGEQMFEISIHPDNTATFAVSVDKGAVQYALSDYKNYLGDSCIFANSPFKGCTIKVVENGELKKEGDEWKITKKATIRFVDQNETSGVIEEKKEAQLTEIEKEQNAGDYNEVARLVRFHLENPEEPITNEQEQLYKKYPNFKTKIEDIETRRQKEFKRATAQDGGKGLKDSKEVTERAHKAINTWMTLREEHKDDEDFLADAVIQSENYKDIQEYVLNDLFGQDAWDGNYDKIKAYYVSIEDSINAKFDAELEAIGVEIKKPKVETPTVKKNEEPKQEIWGITKAAPEGNLEAQIESIKNRREWSRNDIQESAAGTFHAWLKEPDGTTVHPELKENSKDEILEKIDAFYNKELVSLKTTPNTSINLDVPKVEITQVPPQKDDDESGGGEKGKGDGSTVENTAEVKVAPVEKLDEKFSKAAVEVFQAKKGATKSQLQSALGVPIPRLDKILNQLENAKLVTFDGDKVKIRKSKFTGNQDDFATHLAKLVKGKDAVPDDE